MAWTDLTKHCNRIIRDVYRETVLYTPQGGAAVTIGCPFDKAYKNVTIVDGTEISTTRPVIDVVLTDLTVAPRHGDAVVVAGESYHVSDVQPNGHGTVQCFLVQP